MTNPKKKLEAIDDDELARSAGAERAYDTFLPLAEALLPAEVTPFRADMRLVLFNVSAGTKALLEERARLAKELPALNLTEVQSLPDLALAVLFAVVQVDRGASASTGAIRAMLARAMELRLLMLTAASSLALAGLIPTRAVAKIREGRGSFDVAEDCVSLAALFRASPVAIKKTVVTAAQVREAAELGTKLLDVLRPRKAKAKGRAPAAVVQAAARRDRLWSLLVQRYDRAHRAAVWLYGREVDAHVPALMATGGAKKAARKGAASVVDAEPEAQAEG